MGVLPCVITAPEELHTLAAAPPHHSIWVTRRSLSSGGHSADPVAGDDTMVDFKHPP